jgi:hypothetical protein
MPENTNRKAALRKSNPLPELKPKSKPIPKPVVRKVRKGVGILEIPVHVSSGPQRLPENEAEYLHRARPTDAPPSKSQVQAVAMFRQGVGLPEIAKSTGLPSQTLIKTLKPEGLSEFTHKRELESLSIYYENRHNP